MQTLQQLKSGELLGAKKLRLSCGLTMFPPEILELAGTLEILDLSGNGLSVLPDDFSRLQRLKIAFFSDNNFTEFPAVLARCPRLEMIGFKANSIAHIPDEALSPNLRWLILTNNRLRHIPATIGKCPRLQKLMLAGNLLEWLPVEMQACQKLELIRISANRIQELPGWLFSLPALSWLAYGGNPCNEHDPINDNLAEIDWDDLTIAEQLGEGASGIIAKAQWRSKAMDSAIQEVAVKVFKGEVTSDGLPADEMNACMAAGSHTNLVPLLGKIVLHPARKQGLVLRLIPPDYKNLGGPPSFETCTRDTYTDQTVFSVDQLTGIALAMANVAVHLHARGVMHGDFYAHNILVNETSHALLGDFGAATMYRRADSGKAFFLERIEVRAFGCLLEDLLDHAEAGGIHGNVIASLVKLKQDCMQAEVAQRPDFVTIYDGIKTLAASFQNEWSNASASKWTGSQTGG